ncbi:hypothetical protein SK128_005095 [Halocaridina rubra]|uniref:Hexosyltransferase n=1 Tax=Halocaridina rubra TaxID=373956 RepID=A0AAN8ZWN8_HALRR
MVHVRKPLNYTDSLPRQHTLTLDSKKAIKACNTNNVGVILMVSSAVSHHKEREAIRQSWTGILPFTWILVFFLGSTNDAIQQDSILEEGKNHDDIIQDSRFTDSYTNLTLKTLALMQWTQEACKDAKFLLKIDDDMYLNIPKLLQVTSCITEARRNMYIEKRSTSDVISYKQGNGYTAFDACLPYRPYEMIHYFINAETREYESYFFGGYLYQDVRADRNKNSKWYLDPTVYAPTFLPPFLSGTAYIMSTNLIPHLLQEAKRSPIIELEDVYISGILGSNTLKLKLSHIDGWNRFRPQWNSLCLYREIITAHGLSPPEIQMMTASVNRLDLNECNTLLVYIMNLINSSLSSLFPRIT